MNKHKKTASTKLEVISKNGVVLKGVKPTKGTADSDILKEGKENKGTVSASEKLIFAWINPYD